MMNKKLDNLLLILTIILASMLLGYLIGIKFDIIGTKEIDKCIELIGGNN